MEAETDTFLNRRSELLYLARKTRLQWIDGGGGGGGPGAGAGRAEAEGTEALLTALPALRCLEDVLGLLTELSGDTESVQLAALVHAHSMPEESEEEGDLPDYSDSDSGMDPYAVLIAKLKRRSSTEVVKGMQGFVQGVEADMRAATSNFAGSMDDKLASVANSIWVFLKKTHALMRESACWRGEGPEQWATSRDSLEVFLFNKLHRSLFIEDAAGDAELSDRIETLGFLSPEHLDIRGIVGDGVAVLARPVHILRDSLSGSGSLSPAAKVQCLRECSAAISKNLTDFKQDGGYAGADEFLPVLILTIKEANPRQLRSNMKYILQFTDPGKLASEAGYLLTQFVSAVQFLETVDASALTISPLEFEIAVARCRADGRKLSGDFQARNALLESSLSLAGGQGTAPGPESGAGAGAASKKDATPLGVGSALSVLLQRRRYSADRGAPAPPLGIGTSINRKEGGSRGAAGLSPHRAQESRLALLRALDRYDCDTHGPLIHAWSGSSDAQPGNRANGRLSGNNNNRTAASETIAANAALPILNYVDAPIETLGVADVPKLLAEYKSLAKICAVLVSAQMAHS
jgi:hypothetical protein